MFLIFNKIIFSNPKTRLISPISNNPIYNLGGANIQYF